jgi:superfamily II DNA or RNA helicase
VDVTGKYQADCLQAYAAALQITHKSPINVAEIPPGQGKSFIIMLLAKFYRNFNPKKRVLILTTSKMLVE